MQTAVPSLTKYYNRDGSKVRNALLWGSLLTLGIYVFWQIAIFGNIDRSEFPAIISAGGNIGGIMGALADNGLDLKVSSLLQLFSNMAVASSFLGVALCLYDYLSDLFGFGEDLSGRLKTAAITFVPPTLLGVLLPNGFITAIGFAGLVMVIFCVLSPVLMAWIGRQKSDEGYQVRGGLPRMGLVLAFGLLSMTLAGMDAFGLLPAFGK